MLGGSPWGQLHVPLALTSVFIEKDAGWAPTVSLDFSEKNPLSLPRIKPRFFGRPTCSVVAVTTSTASPPFGRKLIPETVTSVWSVLSWDFNCKQVFKSPTKLSLEEKTGGSVCRNRDCRKHTMGATSLALYKAQWWLSALAGLTLRHSACWRKSCGSQKKEQLFPYAALTDWFLQPRLSVFTARYGLGIYMQCRLTLVFRGLRYKTYWMYLKGGQVWYMESCTAEHTHRALDSPTQLYRGAVWLDQAADLRHSTSSTHERAFWCVVTAIRCSYRLAGVFCRVPIQSSQLPRNINSTLTHNNLWLLILNY